MSALFSLRSGTLFLQSHSCTDAETVKKLISRYDISYIFVGGQEKEKYGTGLNDSVLQSLGSIVFEDDMSGTYIVKVEQD